MHFKSQPQATPLPAERQQRTTDTNSPATGLRRAAASLAALLLFLHLATRQISAIAKNPAPTPAPIAILTMAAALSPDLGVLVLLVDARPAERFHGRDETVDPVAGHIPGAVSVPARSLLAADGTFLPQDELQARLRAVGIDGERPVATYCGSGVQASHLALGIAAAGLGRDVPVYVGSWSDWITDPNRPVEVDTADAPG